MFQVGDYVVYGFEGVCRVEEIGCPCVGGLDCVREYYRLISHTKGNVIYAPVDGKIAIRQPISRQEAEAILAEAETLPVLEDIPQDGRRAGDYYKTLLAEHNPLRLMQLCKTMHRKQETLTKNRRTVNATEQRNWKTAEDMLLDELAFALGTDGLELREALRSRYSCLAE